MVSNYRVARRSKARVFLSVQVLQTCFLKETTRFLLRGSLDPARSP
jgi:hypothetical protein